MQIRLGRKDEIKDQAEVEVLSELDRNASFNYRDRDFLSIPDLVGMADATQSGGREV